LLLTTWIVAWGCKMIEVRGHGFSLTLLDIGWLGDAVELLM